MKIIHLKKDVIMHIPVLPTKIITIISTIIILNVFCFFIIEAKNNTSKAKALYLKDYANVYIKDIDNFTYDVIRYANKLRIPAEWLMAVIYSESRFNPKVQNFKGSGATGLIQFMPQTAKELGTNVENIKNMEAKKQLKYVFKYLNNIKKINGENYKSITELYLAILYPSAVKEHACYILYSKPSKTYQQNSGLDEDKDGHVSVQDISNRLQRLFPTAFKTKYENNNILWQ